MLPIRHSFRATIVYRKPELEIVTIWPDCTNIIRERRLYPYTYQWITDSISNAIISRKGEEIGPAVFYWDIFIRMLFKGTFNFQYMYNISLFHCLLRPKWRMAALFVAFWIQRQYDVTPHFSIHWMIGLISLSALTQHLP